MPNAKNQRPSINRSQQTQRPKKQPRPKAGEVAPVLDSMFIPDDDGLALEDYPHTTAEDNADYELSEAIKRIKAEKRSRREQYRVLTDPNFYLVVCFQSTMQRDEFIEKAGWQNLGMPFVDGLALARLLNVNVQPIFLPRKQTRPTPKALRSATNLKPRKDE